MVSKKSHLTKSKVKVEKPGPLVLEEYFCLKEMQPKPVTMRFLELLAEKLVEWADLEDSLSINKFYRITKIVKSQMQIWRTRCPRLEMAYQYTLAALGERREEGAITRKYDTGAVWKRQYQFGDEYKEAMVFAAMLAKKEDENAGNKEIKVIVPDIRTIGEMLKNIENGEKE